MKRRFLLGFLFCCFIAAFYGPQLLALYSGSGVTVPAIVELPTDIAGMVGAAEKGPLTGPPVLVTGFAEFQRIFGGFPEARWGDARYLADAAQGFFANGGRKLYIKRVAGNSAGMVPSPADYIGSDNGPGRRTGLQALADIDKIAIVAVPGITATPVCEALIRHCEKMGDRFAILDAPFQSTPDEAVSHRLQLNSRDAALYYPWLVMFDPVSKRNVTVPPSGHLAGLYAQIDYMTGVHKAPANQAVSGITGLDCQPSTPDYQRLDFNSVNTIRYFNGRGNLVWSARTLSTDNEWKYINVRRLYLMLKEAITQGLGWVIWEPNNEKLWTKVKASVAEFLRRIWRSGALQGAQPEQAFFVKIGRDTMTQQDIDNGRVIIEVGIAPVQPGEFTVFQVGWMKK